MNLRVKKDTCFFLSFIIIFSLFSTFSLNIFPFTKAYAQEDIDVQPPTACVFNDNVDPKQDPDDCFPISNSGGTFARDNIIFSVSTDEPVDTFRCSLKDQNGNPVTLVGNQPNPTSCKVTDISAEQTYFNLDDGIYTFQAFVSKEVNTDNNDNTLETRTGKSSTFTFTVGTGRGQSGGAGIDLANPSSPATATRFNLDDDDDDGIVNRLNPIWRSCDANNDDSGQESTVQNGLSAMKYSATGILKFGDFPSQLKKFDTNNFVLQIYVNFVNGGLLAELFPTVENIDKIKSLADLYNMDPYMIPNEQTSRHDNQVPNRIPFGIESVDTDCAYQAPIIATSLETPGVATSTSEGVFKNSNPPFRTCTDSEAANYLITFSFKNSERKEFNINGYQKVKFIITQQISGLNPEYVGTLIFNPYENDEERIDLALSGNSIITECKTMLLY
jgi:hypothetical protein